jgi:hypothetical protein
MEKKSSSTLNDPQKVHMKGKAAKKTHENIKKYIIIFLKLLLYLLFLVVLKLIF